VIFERAVEPAPDGGAGIGIEQEAGLVIAHAALHRIAKREVPALGVVVAEAGAVGLQAEDFAEPADP